PSSPSPRMSVSLARAVALGDPLNGSVPRGSFACWPVGPGRGARASTAAASTCAMTRVPQIWQNLKLGGTLVPHLVHVVPAAFFAGAAAGAPFPPAVDGAFERGRGSSATGSPQRAHCGTPIGVNALHASHTKPTSIAKD